ncbi:hypothetical protein HWV23_16200 [Natronomonas halophila]|uniref:hypothetical protein n=1 Tax=Natronomonas halophila TaxID=2747817 RepID=UPI0015B6E7E8|nr:hypothetical protein [Natronomonas halophila]QLD87198.1 hypothetical protein HWV23_16200 [Natronomonas halophila]
MKRRALLAAAAAATTTGVAGCLRNSGIGDSNPDENEDDAPDESTPEGTHLVDQSFEVERIECGEDYGSHDVTTEDQTVTVEGVIDGNNTCYTAELVRSEYVTDEDTLYVEVESVDDADENEVCSTCIVEIEYMATFEFANGTPDTIRVDQRGQMSGSSSASGSASATPPSETETATPESTDD